MSLRSWNLRGSWRGGTVQFYGSQEESSVCGGVDQSLWGVQEQSPHLLGHTNHAFLLQRQPQAGHSLPRRLALHLGHVGEDLALQLPQLSFHLLSLNEPSAGSPTSKKELTDPGRELRLHLGTKTVSLWEAHWEGGSCHRRAQPDWSGGLGAAPGLGQDARQ